MRSQFEHCSPIWRPNCEISLNKFENFQKKCIKWVLRKENLSYTRAIYLKKCISVDILPIEYRFVLYFLEKVKTTDCFYQVISVRNIIVKYPIIKSARL